MPENQEQYQKRRNDSPADEGAVQQSTTTPVVPSAPAIKARDKHKNVIFGLGITECIMGGLLVVFAISAASLSIPRGYRLQGLLSGIFILVTGILGICAKKNPSACMYKANIVLSILTAISFPICVMSSGFAAALSFPSTSLVVLRALITLIVFGCFIISIVHSAFCCAGLRGKRNHPGAIVYLPQQPPNPQHISGIPNVQYVTIGGAQLVQHHTAQHKPPGVYYPVEVAVPPHTVHANRGISPHAQYSGTQYVPHV